MGWFDDSDDDDDEVQQQQEENQKHGSLALKDEDEEEEDPLEAYMKKIAQETTSSTRTSATGRTGPRAERLNLLNEDEATEHWVEQNKNSTTGSKLEESYESHQEISSSKDNNNNNNNNVDSASARQALDSLFHRAGDHKTQQQQQQQQHDNSDDEIAQSSASHKRPPETLTPLDPVQHEQMHYQPFAKVFWDPVDTPSGHHWRQQHHITCHPGTFDPILHFSQLESVFGKDHWPQLTTQLGYATPTLVQSQTLPVALSGHDSLITAATGQGKTLAYAWPLVKHVVEQPHLEPGETGPMAVILVPTRELAHQVHTQVHRLLKQCNNIYQKSFKALAFMGGTNRYALIQELKKRKNGGCHVAVATPGRLLDMLSTTKHGMTLERVTLLVVDEFDKMLSMGFEAQVMQIVRQIRPDRQTLMLSATVGRKVERVALKCLREPIVRIAVGRTGESSEHVQQHVMVLPSYVSKKQWITEMLPVLAEVGKTLVFVATRADCETLAEELRQSSPSLQIQTLHGDKHQSDRNAALKAFSKGQLGALIATDVAARGLDVRDVSTVVSFDPAKNLDAHTHRVGRAGRLSKQEQKEGTAYTLLTPKNADFAHVLVHAFEREGRHVSAELKELAGKSRKAGNVARRTKWNKSGLGFPNTEDGVDTPARETEAARSDAHGVSYYGPASSTTKSDLEPPPSKRSRWGDRS